MKGMSHSTAKQEPAADNLGEEKAKHRKCKSLFHVFVKQRERENEGRAVVEEVGEGNIEFS